MADLAIQIPSSNRIVPGSHTLPDVTFPPESTTPLPSDLEIAVAEWLSSFNHLIQAGDTSVSKVFLKESSWRDLLCLTWDFHTLDGPEKIEAIVNSAPKGWRIKSLAMDKSSAVGKPQISAMNSVQCFLTVDTDVGRGRGVVRLLRDQTDGGRWKAYTLYTVLQELKGHEELNHDRRPTGVEHGSQAGRKNWKDARESEQALEGDDGPAVLVVGAGQAGLTVAARLKQLDVKTLVIDRSSRVGDNWRNRYHRLVLHDSVWYDHMPYLNFPSNWPIFTPKDKLAEWFEFYASVMELNVWTKTTIKGSSWSDAEKKWTVTLERERGGTKETRTIHPRHIIFATGISGSPNIPPIPGLDSFAGPPITHSSSFPGLDSPSPGSRAVIIGSCNSAHDIAQDFYEHGYDVTIVQRSSTLVLNSTTLREVLHKGVYDETGPPLDDADLLSNSFPAPLLKRLHIDATAETTRRDTPLLTRLQAAGFKLDNGPDNSGLWQKYLHRGGGYYIDVGASELIADGKIKVKQGVEVSRINPHSVSFADGTELPADEIVLATGYGSMKEAAEKVFGKDAVGRCGEVWGFDEEGETRGLWRSSGHEGFWFMGGNLAQCRYFSRLVALQIKAVEAGMKG